MSDDKTTARLRQAVRAIGVLESRLKAQEAAANAPIAIIGLGCRLPGGIADPARFWEVLRDGEDLVDDIPPERWDIDLFHDPQILAPGKMITRAGAVLRDVDRFDADYFGISPREARAMDPQQRIALEVAKEAFDHAGLSGDAVEGSACGVFLGVTESEYAWHNYVHLAGVDGYTATGSYGGIVANRISYLFDLKGPSFTVDSICSSSLLAVHQAVESLRRGECDTALAGGICVLTGPDQMIWLSKLGVLAKGNRCRAFDAAGDGIVLGEGCGLVVLKPLAQAQQDGDRVLAVIRGNGTTQDGRSNGMTAPSRAGQEAMLRRAYAKAGRLPREVDYVDGHGTGTQLGDPIEAAALGAVLGKGRDPDHPLRLGSVKTNLAHLGPAGGIASLIKVVLALHNRQIPASLHFSQANPEIPMAQWGLEVPTATLAWPVRDGQLPLAGVTSLAFGGTNVHLVVEAAPEAPQSPPDAVGLDHGARILPLTARSQAALQAKAAQWVSLLGDTRADPRALCQAAAAQQDSSPWRALLWAGEGEDLIAPLQALALGKGHPNQRCSATASLPSQPVFVCSGHGSHYLGMARTLLETAPIFRETLAAYDAALSRYVSWSLIEALRPADSTSPDHSRLFEDTTFLQPALTGIQIALAALWRSLGIEPAAVIGVSMGEVAAAQIAGLLDLDEAARIITLRTKLLARDLLGQGAMAVCELPAAQAEQRLAPFAGKLSVAVAQGPRATVLSGDPTAMAALGQTLEADDIFFRMIKVDFASHSHFVDPVLDELVAELGQLGGRPAQVPFWSSVTGELLDGAAVTAGYWADNLRQPVLFQPLVTRLIEEEGLTCFLELSPHPLLTPALQDCLADLGHTGKAVPSLNRDQADWRVVLASLAELYAVGAEVRWEALLGKRRAVLDLPSYPWQRQSYWLDKSHGLRPELAGAGDPQSRPAVEADDLLGQGFTDPAQPGRRLWPLRASSGLGDLLAQHQVLGVAVLPAAAAVTTSLALLARAGRSPGMSPARLENITFDSFAAVAALGQTLLVSDLHQDGGVLELYCHPDDAPGNDPGNDPDARASQRVFCAEVRAPAGQRPSPGALQSLAQDLTTPLDPAAFYDACLAGGGNYGPDFRLIAALRQGPGAALAELRRPDAALRDKPFGPGRDIPVLDACFQVAFAALGEGVVPMVPLSIGALDCWQDLTRESALWCHVLRRAQTDTGATFDLTVMQSSGAVVLRATGLEMRRRAAANSDKLGAKSLQWAEIAAPERQAGFEGGALIVSADEQAGAALCQQLQRADPARPISLASPDQAVARLTDLLSRESRGQSRGDPIGEPGSLSQIFYLAGSPSGGPELPSAAALQAGLARELSPLLSLLQAADRANLRLADGFFLVTNNSQKVLPSDQLDPLQAAVWTLGQSAALEQPGLSLVLLDGATGSGRPLPVDLVGAALENLPGRHLAWREGALWSARLAPLRVEEADARQLLPAGARSFRLAQLQPGLPDALAWIPSDDLRPGPGEVLLAVAAAALNFLDVARALGLVNFAGEPDFLPFGMEAAGRVVAVGEQVTTVTVGQAVLAVTAHPRSLARQVVTSAALVRPLPRVAGQALSFPAAAAQPIAYLTALYALQVEGRIAPGQKVLIHAASGGVGLAAVAVAQAVGAEIYATAGSAEKRRYLRELGCLHVYDSRSLSFAEEIRADTDGRGVDLVLNSLAGEAARVSLELLAPFGRFLEIGKADQQRGGHLALAAFAANLSYHAIDVARLLAVQPQAAGALLDQLCQGLEKGLYPVLPWQVYGHDQVSAAFTELARARHRGKLVIALEKPEETLLSDRKELTFSPQGAVVITGGTGGLGLCFARWAAERGARKLALLARATAPEAARQSLADLERDGVELRWVACDVTQPHQVDRALAEVAAELGPIEGLFHGAAAIADRPLSRLDWPDFETVLAPKVAGALHLLAALRDQPLKIIVCFSSTAALLGTTGQANYAVANGVMAALAEKARASGLPVTVIDWGPWAEVGGVARLGLEGRFAALGLTPHRPAAALAAFDQVLQSRAGRAAIMDLDAELWLARHPGGDPGLFALLAGRTQGAAAGSGAKGRISGDLNSGDSNTTDPTALTDQLAGLASAQRQDALVAELCAMAAAILGITAAQIDAAEQTLGTLGFDSLMSLELRNRLEAALDLKLPATLAWNYPVFADLAAHLLTRLDLADPDPAGRPEGGPGPQPATPDSSRFGGLGEAAIAAMSEDEAEAELLKRLAGLENQNPDGQDQDDRDLEDLGRDRGED